MALLKLFVDLCLLRANPQDLPASTTLVWLTGAAAVLTGLHSPPRLPAAVTAAATVLFMGLIVHTALVLRGRSERWRQTISALYGAMTLIGLAAIPIVVWMQRTQDGPGSLWPALLGAAVLVWFLAVTGHILRHALDVTPGIGILLGVGLFAFLLLGSATVSLLLGLGGA